jgi:hypothetical protein
MTGPIQLSEYLADPKTIKPQTSQRGGGLNKKAKSDWIKDEVISQCSQVLRYMVIMRSQCFVCQTQHIDRVGIKIFKQFYVDL